ncbi:invasion associated locus B family protein [Rhizobium anhuiense]
MKKLVYLAVAATLAASVTVHAAPTKLGTSGDWGIYAFDRDGKKTCYVLSVPKDVTPAGVDHGENYFLIAPAEGADRPEPEAIMGYPLQAGSMARITVGSKSFRMFTRDHAAWVNDTSRTPELMAALRAGSSMVLEAISARGTHTSYTYSLDGITAALARSSGCR